MSEQGAHLGSAELAGGAAVEVGEQLQVAHVRRRLRRVQLGFHLPERAAHLSQLRPDRRHLRM